MLASVVILRIFAVLYHVLLNRLSWLRLTWLSSLHPSPYYPTTYVQGCVVKLYNHDTKEAVSCLCAFSI